MRITRSPLVQLSRRRLVAWLGVLVAAGSKRPLHAQTPTSPSPFDSPVLAHALRLHPGDDLRTSLMSYAERHGVRAAAIASCAGSLTKAEIRFADQREGTAIAGPLEIVSLSGTLAATGGYLHIAVSDGAGKTLGGHLLAGCPIYTTAEIVLLEMSALAFTRERDAATTYDELVIRKR